MRKTASGLALALSLVACSDAAAPNAAADAPAPTVEESAAEAAKRVQALGEVFSVVEVAARTQTAFRVDPDKAKLIISAVDRHGAPVLDETFHLKSDQTIESAALSAQIRPGYSLATFSLAADDSGRMLSLRQRLAALKEAAPGENELTMNAYVTGCLKDGFETPDALRLTFFLRIRPNEDFFPLFAEMEIPNTGRDFQSGFWTPCGEKRGT
ncbi:MAG: hypothetical protein AAGI03_06155 [Pseudomonadota bacterium]